MRRLLGQHNLRGELSGSIGDIGTFLPYVIGVITIGGLDPTGVLFGFGAMYLFTGFFYRAPVAVQPMKIIGAAIIVQQISAGEAAAGGILLAVTLLLLAFSGLIDKCAQVTPASVIAGIQAALGISLGLLGIKYISIEPWLGILVSICMLFLLKNQKLPASVAGVAGGTLLWFLIHPGSEFPHMSVGLYLPHLVWPAWLDFQRGAVLAFLPQLPLTLTNAVLVSAMMARELFPETAQRSTERNLCITMGIGNLITIPLGGLAMCHGSGGIAAHYRFGGRTGLTPILIGIVLLFLGLLLGPDGVVLLKMIPQSVMGALLLFGALELLTSFKSMDQRSDTFCFAVVLVLSVALNPGLGFVAGLILTALFRRGWIQI